MLMDYRIKRVGQSDELEHALFGIGKKKSSSSSGSGSGQQGAKKGSTWSNHLYIARQKAGDGWRYFYSQAELQAAKAKGAAKQAAKNVGDTARKGLATVKRSAADLKGYAGKVDSDRNRYKEAIKKEHTQSERALGRRSTYDQAVKAQEDVTDYYQKERSRANKIANDLTLGPGTRRDNKEYAEYAKESVAASLRLEAKNREKAEQAKEAQYRYTQNEGQLQKNLNDYNKSVDKAKYAAGTILNKTEDAINKGKSAVSKLFGDTKAAAGKAITTASDRAKSLADKGKAAVDKLGKVLSGEYHKEVNLEGDRINEAMIKSNRTAKRLAGLDDTDDNSLLTYTYKGGRAQKKADETLDYRAKQIYNDYEKRNSAAYKLSKSIAGAKDKVEDAKDAVSKSIEKAQEDFYETRRDVREFAAKAKNFVTDKTYRNDKTYRDMVDGVKSMQEDLKSIDAYIRELKASPKMTPSIEKEIKDARALQDEIGNTMVSVRREVEKYKNN